MSWNESLAERIDEMLKGRKGFTRKEMFGGVGYLLNGNMCIGVNKDDLIVRYDPKQAEELMKKKGARPFDIAGRPMKGWVLVNNEGIKGDGLSKWFEIAFSFVKTLPKK
jgi:TfoX/Sxy family transcriptional regulator of competence genes